MSEKIHIQRTIRVTCNGTAVEYSFGTGDKEIIERNLGGDLKRLSKEQLHAFFEATVAAQREVKGGSIPPKDHIMDDEGVIKKDPQRAYTADGKRIRKGHRVWINDDLCKPTKTEWVEVFKIDNDEITFQPMQRIRWMYAELCYSTKEAAVAAKEAKR